MRFEDAYSSDRPVKVTRPNGSEVLVVGFVRYDGAVVYVDDGYLYEIPGSPPIHVVEGKLKDTQSALTVGGHTFSEVEPATEAAYQWRLLFGDTDPEIVRDDAEWEARKFFARHWLSRRLQSIAQ